MSEKLTIVEQLKSQLAEFAPETKVKTVGTVAKVADGIAYIWGLKEAMYGEVITFESGAAGYILKTTAMTNPNIAITIHNSRKTIIKNRFLVRLLTYLDVYSAMDFP